MSDEISSRPDESPSQAEKFASKAHDLDAIRKSVEDAASLSTGLWLSFLGVLVYLGVAAGAVTHKDLLLENPVKLPFLSDVPLPLIAFFVLAPIVFIVSHAYTLVHFVMLAAKVGVYNTELKNQVGGATETKEYLRWQLPSNIFVQILAGPARIRNGGLGLLLQVIAWNSLVFGPIFLLLLIQVQFLPFHREWVTWVQRCALLADLTLLWALWPSVVKRKSEIKWPHPWHYPGFALASLCALGLAFTAVTFPGEWMEQWIGRRQWIPPNRVTAWLGQKDKEDQLWTSFHDLLFNGEYDDKILRRKSPFSNTLLLPKFSALEAAKIDETKLDAAEQTFTRKRQHFESARFRGADLRKANLENAFLQGADFYQAKLQGAVLFNAELQGAALVQAHLQRASLVSAHLQGANLSEAELHGAFLLDAEFQGASFEGAHLQGASFEGAPPQGTLLDRAHLQAARLDGAYLQGASLKGANLQGASLKGAHLQGASLEGAQLQGASLEGAQLQGASLEGAQLQGARFLKANLHGTNMRDVAVWRTSFEDASLTAVFEDGVKESALPANEFAALQAYFKNEVPEGGQRDQALERVEILNPDLSGNQESAGETPEKGRADKAEYQQALRDELKSLACSGDESAPYVVRGLVRYRRINDTGPFALGLIKSILAPDCPVSAALTDTDKAALKKQANEAQPSESK